MHLKVDPQSAFKALPDQDETCENTLGMQKGFKLKTLGDPD
jgi:hypothetical protein